MCGREEQPLETNISVSVRFSEAEEEKIRERRHFNWRLPVTADPTVAGTLYTCLWFSCSPSPAGPWGSPSSPALAWPLGRARIWASCPGLLCYFSL